MSECTVNPAAERTLLLLRCQAHLAQGWTSCDIGASHSRVSKGSMRRRSEVKHDRRDGRKQPHKIEDMTWATDQGS